MPRPNSGPFALPQSSMGKITQEIPRLPRIAGSRSASRPSLRSGTADLETPAPSPETYRGELIKASSFDDLQRKRAAIDRMIAQRICDAPDAATRAAILRGLYRSTGPKPARKKIAASTVEMGEDAA